jgi:hypothetical protein
VGSSDVNPQSNDETNQHCGVVDTNQGRCIAFSNLYQHRVSPFRLLDPTKPGHRKILALFLVHPEIRIPSTSSIPDQQAYLSQAALNDSLNCVFPGEVLEMINDRMVDKITEDEARRYREQLMDERGWFVKEHGRNLFTRDFSFCEH